MIRSRAMFCANEKIHMKYEIMAQLCLKVYVILVWFSLIGRSHQQTFLTPTNPTVIENETLTLTCNSTNGNGSFFVWLRENSEVGVFNINKDDTCYPTYPSVTPNRNLYEHECRNRSLFTLTIKRVTSLNHGDEWECYAEKTYSNAINISVTVPPSDIKITKPSSSIASFVENTIFTFTCTVTRTIPEADVAWFYSNRTIDDTAIHQSVSTTSQLNPDKTFATTSMLSLFGKSSMREGIIYCTANAGDGSTVFKSRMVTLDIWYKPRKSPSFQNSDELVRVSGATAIFRLVIVAYPVPSPDDFVWEMYTESSWTVIESTSERQILVRDGLETSFIIYRVSESDYGLYRVTVSNEIGALHWNFKLLPPQTPTSPFTLWVINETVTFSSATLQWTRGFNGGLPQTFLLEYKQKPSVSWSTVIIEDGSEPFLNHTMYGLVSGSSYEARIRSRNNIGASNYSSIIEFQTLVHKSEISATNDKNTWIIGAVGGGVVFLVVSGIVVIVCRKYKGRHDRDVVNEGISTPEKDLNTYAEIDDKESSSKGYQELITRRLPNSATYTGVDNPAQTPEDRSSRVDRKKTKPVVWRKQKAPKVKATVENTRAANGELSIISSVRRENPAPREKSETDSRDYLHPVSCDGPQANTKSTTGNDNNLKKDANNSEYLEMDFYAKQVKRLPKTKEEDAERKSEKDNSEEDDSKTKTGDKASYLNLEVKVAL